MGKNGMMRRGVAGRVTRPMLKQLDCSIRFGVVYPNEDLS